MKKAKIVHVVVGNRVYHALHTPGKFLGVNWGHADCTCECIETGDVVTGIGKDYAIKKLAEKIQDRLTATPNPPAAVSSSASPS